ncbi:protein of unknown function [Magnetospirillum sp. XM-1]|nr:protein of unknown function [Magnetospirillum sp. XM-1]
MTVNRSNHPSFEAKNLVRESDNQAIGHGTWTKTEDQVHGLIWGQVKTGQYERCCG